jgi:hypothetical protein
LNKRLFWGADFIVFSGLTYEPSFEQGEAAAIMPASDEEGLIDLVACRLRDRRIATRRRNARALGEHWIEVALFHHLALPLFADPLRWLANDMRGVVILDWSQIGFVLDGLDAVVCDSPSLAKRVHDTTRRMARPPRLRFIQRSKQHVS